MRGPPSEARSGIARLFGLAALAALPGAALLWVPEPGLRAVLHTAEALGLRPPASLEAYRSVTSVANPVVASFVLGGLACLLAALRGREPGGRLPARLLLVVGLVPLWVAGGVGLRAAWWLHEVTLGSVRHEAPPPAAVAALADEALAAVRTGLRERRGTVRLPDGSERSFFLFAVPGAALPPGVAPRWDEVRGLPACVLLPRGEPGATVPEEDPEVLAPTARHLDLAALARGEGQGPWRAYDDGAGVPAAFDPGRPDGLTYALALRRAAPALDAPLRDDLYVVRVLVFQEPVAGEPRRPLAEVSALVRP